MKKTVTLLSLITILGTSAAAMPLSVSADSITASNVQQLQNPATLPSVEISSVELVHYNTVRISFKTPIILSQYYLSITYTGTDQVDRDLGGEPVLNANGNLIAYDINLDNIAAYSTDNATIASTLKFKIINNTTSEMNVSSITNSTLINYIKNAIDYGQIEKYGTMTDFTKSKHFSLYFEDEISSQNILAGKATTESYLLQLEDKQVNNSNISYSVVDKNGNIVGQVSEGEKHDPTVFITPTNSETFQKDITYHVMATNSTTHTTEEVFSFTPFYIF